MSGVEKLKEFFGLGPMDTDDGYYGDEPVYSREATARAYDPEPRMPERGYQMAPRAYEPTIVAEKLSGYTESARIGEPFRDGDIVVFTLAMGADEARRVVDFAAGLCFALNGRMRKVSTGVFALVPDGVKISTVELERAAEL